MLEAYAAYKATIGKSTAFSGSALDHLLPRHHHKCGTMVT
jgi:hypothetical protein